MSATKTRRKKCRPRRHEDTKKKITKHAKRRETHQRQAAGRVLPPAREAPADRRSLGGGGSNPPAVETRSRFAPAPTGRLHLGHVANAIYVWGATRAAGGRVLLRIEDHDRQRSRPEFERGILDDLDWLGFEPDEPVTNAFRAGSCTGRQSDRTSMYEAALDRLRAGGLIYACECSRRALEQASPVDGERRYPGTCRDKGLPLLTGFGLRVRLDRSVERFQDLRHGEQSQCPYDQCGDVLVRDREGNWAYQFAVTVDDDVQGVTLVIRGDDLLESTGRQIQLARLLGRTNPPRFLHHPLIMKSATQKLSKADKDTSVEDLRRSGWSAGDVIGEAASRVGLIVERRPLKARDVAELFRADSTTVWGPPSGGP